MTTLNTIIEEEKKAITHKYDLRYFDGSTYAVSEEFEKDFTAAMQRAYEAGRGERDTYWEERVRKESLPESFTIELLEDNYKKCCLAVNNTRIAGLKPTGFAKTVLTFKVNSKALLQALDNLK